MERFDEARLPELGKFAVPLVEVQPGVDYAVLLTTPAGLCRYVIGDVVRFLSTTPPRLIYVGRTRLQLSAFGEHVIEKEVTDALTTVCARHGVVIGNFHVAPKFVAAEAGVRVLFTSEPVTRLWDVGACRLVGRYAVRHDTTPDAVAALVGRAPWARLRDRAGWTAKRAIKAVTGPAYARLADRIAGRTALAR